MDVGLSLVLPGLVGGICIAALLVWLNRRQPRPHLVNGSPLEPLSPDMINMAHIRVAGIGGLGMVAAGVVIAVYVPEIRYALSIGIILGAALAAVLIWYRAHAHRSASDDQDPRVNALLSLEDRPSATPRTKDVQAHKPRRAIVVG